ncbi:MAG: tol-pal system-associated acyl-CoA thioesterase [Burkholderiales bacterium]|jgi:acyl-CoA thioester hydrolase
MTERAHLPAHHGRHDVFRWPVRVYYEDTDAGGVVYYANYLKFMERTRTEWLRFHGFELPALADEHGILFVVRAVEIEYLKPARFNDALDVTLELDEHGRSRISVVQQVLRGSEVLAAARVRAVCVDTQTIRPARIPQSVLDRIAPPKSE